MQSRRFSHDRCTPVSKGRVGPFDVGLIFSGILMFAVASCAEDGSTVRASHVRRAAADDGTVNWLMFHGDRARSGWNPAEAILTPSAVASGNFGKLWDTGRLDLDPNGNPPHFYASPLYVDSVTLTTPDLMGLPFSVVIAASTAGYVYAVNAFDANGISAGTILWSTYLARPAGGGDGVPWGVLGTPAIDLNTTPPTVYVAADVSTPLPRNWWVFGLDLTNGGVLPGWPLPINDNTAGMNAQAGVQQNGPTKFQSAGTMSQRGGLNISWDSSTLYVPFGGYSDTAAGFLVAIDTGAISGLSPSIVSAFASSPSGTVSEANGGLWSSGGPAIDENGVVYATTGNDLTQRGAVPNFWGESLLAWAPGVPLQLVGTYTPWNHCQMDRADTDLAGGAAVVFSVDPTQTSTPHLIAFGGKQGLAYLVDRNNMPGSLSSRPPCHEDPSNIDTPLDPTAYPADGSLFGPDVYPWYRSEDGLNQPMPGPLDVFGPYHESCMNTNYARARSTPAYFQNSDGSTYVIFTGSTKTGTCSTTSTWPSVARLKVQLPGDPTLPSYLTIDAVDQSLIFESPSSPVISSNGPDITTAIIWVIEPHRKRGDSLQGVYPPSLIAVSAQDMTPLSILYTSASTDFPYAGGKYNSVVVAQGTVFTGTDRITAFGLTQ